MKVFVSWSGKRSHELALTLQAWLPMVIQSLKPFVSSEMDKGVRWMQAISDELDTASFGVVCLTPENAQGSWIAFEAGALSKALPGSTSQRVVPIALDFKSLSDLPPPLGLFQGMLVEKADFRSLITTINAQLAEPLATRTLDETFELWWPRLEERITEIGEMPQAETAQARDDSDKIDELLSITRQQEILLLNQQRTALVSPESTQQRREFERTVTAAFFPLESTFEIAWCGNIPDMSVVLVREMPNQKLVMRIEQIGAQQQLRPKIAVFEYEPPSPSVVYTSLNSWEEWDEYRRQKVEQKVMREALCEATGRVKPVSIEACDGDNSDG